MHNIEAKFIFILKNNNYQGVNWESQLVPYTYRREM
jgi:hypothetical protein